MLKLSPCALDLSPEIATILRRLPVAFEEGGAKLTIAQDNTLDGLCIEKSADHLHIRYSQKAYLFRALGLATEQSEETYTLSQNPRYITNGAMIDCSRNAVLTVDALKEYIEQLALMGHNTLMLYTEDTYEIGNNPYFGYMRGRYTTEELQAVDAYAASFGIDVIPCIQTLAHLGTALRWWHQYGYMTDIDDILLVDHPHTYELIEEMIKACRAGFRSKRIHVGMDEAENLGRGKYRNYHGNPDSFDVICGHLRKVMDICEKYDFRPMIWSDMFFKLVAGNEAYYQADLPDEVLSKVPAGVDLVYWNYYSLTPDVYENNCKSHLKFKNNRTVFAGGAWRWSGYVPRIGHSMKVSRMAMDTCHTVGVREAIVTLWGDNGGEGSLYSVHPVVQLYAECSFNPGYTDEELAQRFKTCTGGDIEDFMLPNVLDTPMDTDHDRISNVSKWLLFQDPMMGLADRHVRPGYNAFYAEQAAKLHAAADKGGRYEYVFRLYACLADVLALKAEVGVQLTTAYKAGDKDALRAIATETLPEIAARMRVFKKAAETQWFKENKPFGFEVIDIRIGGTISRVESSASRVLAYVNGEIDALPELAEERLFFNNQPADQEITNFNYNMWHRMVSACNICSI